MKILFFEWNAYMQKDVELCLKKMHIDYRVISYNFKTVEHDDYFSSHFPGRLLEGNYDAVFSMNFIPFVADICFKYNIRYISWTYDCPLDFKRLDALRYPTNYAFLFDRLQYQSYVKMGFQTVYYMPLAIPSERLDAMEITDPDREVFSSDISFVGKIYDSELDKIYDSLSPYHKGYLTALSKAQQKIYGYNFINDTITDGLLNRINSDLVLSTGNVASMITRQQLYFALCTNVTHLERLEILTRLSALYPVALYSTSCPPELDKVDFRHTVSYTDEMPKVFRLSRINLNITLKCIESGIPLRAIDILGSGGFLMCNYQPEVVEYFQNGKEVVCYESVDDLVEKCGYYLSHEEERAEIARQGHDRAHELFSYEKQLTAIFQIAGLETGNP